MEQSRYGQPTRARDVIRHIDIVSGTPDPSPVFVELARAARLDGARSYEDIAKRLRWHEGGPGDVLRKALALID